MWFSKFFSQLKEFITGQTDMIILFIIKLHMIYDSLFLYKVFNIIQTNQQGNSANELLLEQNIIQSLIIQKYNDLIY